MVAAEAFAVATRTELAEQAEEEPVQPVAERPARAGVRPEPPAEEARSGAAIGATEWDGRLANPNSSSSPRTLLRAVSW